MKRYWNAFDEWIGARNARERMLLFASTIVVPIVLLHSLLVQPALVERRRMSQETLTDQAEISKMTLQLQELVRAKGADPDATLRARLAEINGKMSEFQRQTDAQSAELVSPEKMAGVLEKILASSPNIRVVEVKMLPRTTISFDRAAPAASGASAAPPAAAAPVVPAAVTALLPPGTPTVPAGQAQDKKPNEIYRHGVEITMRGNYLDLVAYLKRIESQPVRMFWDKVSLSVSEYPAVTMRVVVYTISLERAWITV